MSSFRIRPRFKHQIKGKKDELERRICDVLEKEKQFVFTHLPDHIQIRIPSKDQHYWSPQLQLSFEQEEDKVIVRGLYGPNPTVWALFFFSYVTIGILGLFVGMWGFSLLMLNKDAWMLWFIPGLGVVALILYLISQAGQKLGAQQMFDLHHFYESVTKDKVIID